MVSTVGDVPVQQVLLILNQRTLVMIMLIIMTSRLNYYLPLSQWIEPLYYGSLPLYEVWNGSLFALCRFLAVAGAVAGARGGGGILAVLVVLTDIVHSDVYFLLRLLDCLELQGLPQILLQTLRTEFL